MMLRSYLLTNVVAAGVAGAVPSNTAALFTDSFNRADENLEANASWTALPLGIAGGLAVVSNKLSSVDTGATGSAYTCPDIGNASQYVQAVWQVTGAVSGFMLVRVTDANNWLGVRYNNVTPCIEIFKRVAGTLTQIAQVVYKITAGDVIKYEQFGQLATVSVNGQVWLGPVDLGSLFPTITKAGLIGRSAAVAGWLDNFEAGTVASLKSSGGFDVAVCGDSLSAGQQSSVGDLQSLNSWPYKMQLATGRFVYNGGVQGQTSTQIATRMNGASVATYRSRIWVIWAGRNNYTAPTTVKTDIASMVATQTSGKYVVMSILNDQSADGGLGGVQYGTVTTLNSDLATLYPSNYLDIRGYLVSLGGPGQPYADPAKFALDQLPAALVADGAVHLTTTAYALIAARVQAFIEAKGW